ncbi:MAG TPA: hypothetical protein VGM30_01865 [Puia sp.]|jgi:hypothetical protein
MTTVSQELEPGILKSKIMELRSALFFTESASILKLPTHIISDVEINEEGQICFVIPRPIQALEAFEQEMPAKLDFFKKGKDFFVKVEGKAQLIDNKEEKLISVVVTVMKSEFIDNTPKPSQNWLQSSRSQLSSWFF